MLNKSILKKGENMRIDERLESLSSLWAFMKDPDGVCGISC
ncbi:hypothetical protein HAL013_03500 [Helicobacter ailurogastricus]|uniref:Uncharacterized protein n=1 Tax=Helicobacter ailurogastricus TaxID=1578720 RepID=A0A0K2XC53_9HELI|nr:hypothetical protein HAL011_01090 [Helicobacter ailurogastricus]CRF42189.1 hypothetical protein HAL013_03500 [Helicobacter ailurogastricus]CRF44920.1 hypothetical protein HAL09_15440 [Helicobacter ailurogastricus]